MDYTIYMYLLYRARDLHTEIKGIDADDICPRKISDIFKLKKVAISKMNVYIFEQDNTELFKSIITF